MLQPYVPLLVLIVFVVANAVLIRRSPTYCRAIGARRSRSAPYESGIPVLGDARERFSVKFYLVAMLFIIFDIETVFMIPWAVGLPSSSRESAASLIVEMFIFIAILGVGLRLHLEARGAAMGLTNRRRRPGRPSPSSRCRRTG